MLRMSRVFLRRLIVALAATVPLLAILAWTLSRGVDDTRDTAYRQILAQSRSAARSVDDALDGAERLLVFVARHQDVRDLDPPIRSGCARWRSTWCRTRSSTTAAAER